MRSWSRCGVASVLAAVFLLAANSPVAAQGEYRGFWVDTFNTTLNNHSDVVAVVTNAKASKANALFVQVRRRGDAWYLHSLEPPPDFVSIAAGFDPLQDMINEAHGNGIEVHAFVIMGAIWNKNPNFAPSPTLGAPTNPNHVFNLHGGYDPATQTIVPDPENWLTRTLLPDGAGGISFQGHRFGSDFWLDFGHPDAEANTVDVLMRLVENYDIDGLHLDRIRYPEFGVSGQTPATGTNVGYNATSIARFQSYQGVPGSAPPPAQNDPAWSQWRRDQVTNVVRRIYLNAIARKPHLKISAALIAFGGTGAAESAWTAAEAYWRVYQDWRAWAEEGILDLAIPMNYKREHVASQQTQFNQWLDWMQRHQYGRAGLIGMGVFLNSVEGSLRQVRRALDEPAGGNNRGAGVVFFSIANPDEAVAANPLSIPPGQNTPKRGIAEFASGLTTGKSVNGATLYEDPVANPVSVFGFPVPVPVHAWKMAPHVGHLKGFVTDETGTIVDTGAIRIERQDTETATVGRSLVTSATDGGGFYGGVDLAPGTYRVTVTPVRTAPYMSCPAVITTGAVTTLDFTIDRAVPSTTVAAHPQEIWPPNGGAVPVTISGEATDVGTGIASVAFRVIDEYGEVESLVATEPGFRAVSMTWSRQLQLQASRRGDDSDGRKYTVEVTVTDAACNSNVVNTTVVVAHDQRRRAQ
jgi:uncharacterized lipoprotein YddW (UPF0748 family)